MRWVRLSSQSLAGEAKMTLCKHHSVGRTRLIVSNPSSLVGTSSLHQLYFKFTLGNSASSLSSCSTAGTALGQLHPGGYLWCTCMLHASSLPIPRPGVGLRLSQEAAETHSSSFSAAALGVSKHVRKHSWKFKPWCFFSEAPPRLFEDLG